jgi:XTP/dITP diphosphohydrolase
VKEICTVVLASRHEGKLAELRELLSGLGATFVAARDLGLVDMGGDDELLLERAALRKATQVSRAAGLIALAEESGLEVTALGGRPGARSTRHAHGRATDAENNAALLRDLEEVEGDARAARFRSVLALASPWSEGHVWVEGTCEGRIARAPRGSGGFGYEPLFVLSDMEGRSLAELSADERRAVSPRVRAAMLMRSRLEEILTQLVSEAERLTR